MRQPDVVMCAPVDTSDQKRIKNSAYIVRSTITIDKKDEDEILSANSEESNPTRKPNRGQKDKG